MSKQPIEIDWEKKYRIDEAGNVDVERNWILINRTNRDVDISEVAVYVEETVDALVNAQAKDSSGSLDIRQEGRGSIFKLGVSPRIDVLSPSQKYEITLEYQFPNNVHKLGEMWLFSDMISGINTEEFSELITDKTDLKLRVVLPRLNKRFWQSAFHESNPLFKELPKEEKSSQYADNIVLALTSSLFSNSVRRVELVYGVRTNAKLAGFLIFLGTAFIGKSIDYAFNWLKGGG